MENNPSPIELFREAMYAAEQDPDNVDIQSLYETVKDYVEHMIEPQRADETQDAYKVRVFANLMEQNDHPVTVTCNPNDLIRYAREATDSDDEDTARYWYSRMIGDALDSTSWALYGAFCIRLCELDEAIECTRTAIAVDNQNQLALFVHVATLMTARTEAKPAVELDELKMTLETLTTAHPRFSQGHVLKALHCRRMDMSRQADRSLSEARLSVNDYDDNSWAALLSMTWEPIDHEGDPAIKCAALLVSLDLAKLAMACMLCFRSKLTNTYHLLMAVSHHMVGEYRDSVDHLNSMTPSAGRFNSRRLLMKAHNNYSAGNIEEAMVQYIGLSLRPTRSRYLLAYTRTGDYFLARGRPAEAVEAYHRACIAVSPTPVLFTKMGVCLLALNRFTEAERLLAEAIAVVGADNGQPWHHLAEVHVRCGRDDLAEFCYRRASELGYDPDITIDKPETPAL